MKESEFKKLLLEAKRLYKKKMKGKLSDKDKERLDYIKSIIKTLKGGYI